MSNAESTLMDIYEENADMLALCRAKWIASERQEALHLYEQAAMLKQGTVYRVTFVPIMEI